MSPDPWTSFLDWLTTVLVPSWGELIALLPYLLLIGVIGPLLTLIVAMWAWYLLNRRRGRVRRSEPRPMPAPLDAAGEPVFPVNAPYCEEHTLVFPPRERLCSLDGDQLKVICPVDGTVRSAEVDTCSACGTRFKLGAGSSGAVILSSEGPPKGGAAVA